MLKWQGVGIIFKMQRETYCCKQRKICTLLILIDNCQIDVKKAEKLANLKNH